MLDTDPLTTAFAAFKDEAPRDIVAPGARLAHRTVARRRVTSAVAVAAVVALALVGYAQFITQRPSPVKAMPAATASGPSRTGTGALSAIAGLTPTTLRQQHSLLFAAYGTLQATCATYATCPADETDDIGFQRDAGHYELRATCVGAGSARISWQSGDVKGSVNVPCGQVPTVVRATVIVTTDNNKPQFSASAVATSAAADDAGYAIVVATVPSSQDSLSTLSSQVQTLVTAARNLHREYMMSAGGPLDEVKRDTDSGDSHGVAASRYVMNFSCADSGRVTVVWSIGGTTTNASIPCDRRDHRLTLDPHASGPMVVVTTPDLDAVGHAAYALVVQ